MKRSDKRKQPAFDQTRYPVYSEPIKKQRNGKRLLIVVVFGLILGGVLGYLIKEDQAQVFRLAEPTVTVQAATKTKSAAGKQDVKLSKRERQLIKTERKASKLAKQTKKSVWKELKLIIPGFVIFSAVIMLLTDSDGPRYYR